MYPTTAPAALRLICCDQDLLSPSQTPFKFKKPRSTDALNALKVQWQSEETTNGSPAAAGPAVSRGGEALKMFRDSVPHYKRLTVRLPDRPPR